MTLTKKFILTVVLTIFTIITVNIVSIFFFSGTLFQGYIKSKDSFKEYLTLEEIEKIIDKETYRYIENLFQDVEVEYLSLLKENDGKIPLNSEKNRSVVINYLIDKGLSPKSIQELIPQNNLESLLQSLKDNKTPEWQFLLNLITSIVFTNLVIILIAVLYFLYFSQKTVRPINEITNQIKKFQSGQKFEKIIYDKRDEIGIMVEEINNLNDNLAKQENIRSKFLADISHELKTPITAVRCYLEWIADWVIEANSDNLDRIVEEMWRLVKLVNMIMDYERFENKDLDLEFEEKIINNTIHWVVEQYKNNLIISSQQIDFDEKKTLLRYDEEKIVQIVHNVISNFLKYAWKWTTLSIKIRENFIEFADNWWWVNEKNIPYLTEKFYQEDESKTWSANERGIWVGLSIVDKVVKWHKWKMKIDNNNGNGFRILIFTKSSH